HRAAEERAAAAYQDVPRFRFDADPSEDWRECCIDEAPLVRSNRTAAPVHERQVIAQGEGKTSSSAIRFVAEGREPGAYRGGRTAPPRVSQPRDALIDRSELRLLRALGDPCSDRIEIHMRHGSEQACLIEQGLRLESSLPESTLAPIFLVRAPCQVLVQAAHVPTDIAQPLSPSLDDSLCRRALGVQRLT